MEREIEKRDAFWLDVSPLLLTFIYIQYYLIY